MVIESRTCADCVCKKCKFFSTVIFAALHRKHAMPCAEVHRQVLFGLPTYDNYFRYLNQISLVRATTNCMVQKTTQDFLFQRIREMLPADKTLVDEVAEILHVSEDSAYRRIRGGTPLVLEEAALLCRRFNLSLDGLLDVNEDCVVFRNMEPGKGSFDFKTYLSTIAQQINALAACNQKSIVYLTNDVPIFHQFSSKALLAFRFFFWMRTVFQHPDFQHNYSAAWLLPDIEELAADILSVYCKIPSVEIWNTECANSTLVQVNHYYEAGVMTKADAAAVRAGLHEAAEHVEQQAAYGCKFKRGESPRTKKDNFQLFYNRVGLGNNVILTLHDGSKTLYLNYDALNYMITSDKNFCNKTYHQMQNTMRRSTLISGVAEKQRNMFFNDLYAKMHVRQLNNQETAK